MLAHDVGDYSLPVEFQNQRQHSEAWQQLDTAPNSGARRKRPWEHYSALHLDVLPPRLPEFLTFSEPGGLAFQSHFHQLLIHLNYLEPGHIAIWGLQALNSQVEKLLFKYLLTD